MQCDPDVLETDAEQYCGRPAPDSSVI
jgi:hypothetical protein